MQHDLLKTASPPPKAIAQDSGEPHQKTDKYQKITDVLKWLYKTFPKCFNSKTPRPLKLEIYNDIVAHLPLELSKRSLRRALNYFIPPDLSIYILLGIQRIALTLMEILHNRLMKLIKNMP